MIKTMKYGNERVGLIRKQAPAKIVDVEYRVLWNEGKQGWDVLRNCLMTDVSGRKKRKSAIDSAVRDAKAEFETSKVSIVVICLQGRKLETVWKGP
jgi:hypothetical protein